MAIEHKVVKIDEFFTEDSSGDYTDAEDELDAIGVDDWILDQIIPSIDPNGSAICIFHKSVSQG